MKIVKVELKDWYIQDSTYKVYEYNLYTDDGTIIEAHLPDYKLEDYITCTKALANEYNHYIFENDDYEIYRMLKEETYLCGL